MRVAGLVALLLVASPAWAEPVCPPSDDACIYITSAAAERHLLTQAPFCEAIAGCVGVGAAAARGRLVVVRVERQVAGPSTSVWAAIGAVVVALAEIALRALL